MNWPLLMIWYFHRKFFSCFSSFIPSYLIHFNSRCIQNSILGICRKIFVYNIQPLSLIKYRSFPFFYSKLLAFRQKGIKNIFLYFSSSRNWTFFLLFCKNPPTFNDVKWKKSLFNDLLNFPQHWAPLNSFHSTSTYIKKINNYLIGLCSFTVPYANVVSSSCLLITSGINLWGFFLWIVTKTQEVRSKDFVMFE